MTSIEAAISTARSAKEPAIATAVHAIKVDGPRRIEPRERDDRLEEEFARESRTEPWASAAENRVSEELELLLRQGDASVSCAERACRIEIPRVPAAERAQLRRALATAFREFPRLEYALPEDDGETAALVVYAHPAGD